MAFMVNDIIVDRVVSGIMMNTEKTRILGYLTHLQDVTLNTTSESKEKNDENGTLIKRFPTGKNTEISMTNAMLNLDMMATQAGTEIVRATADNTITMPASVEVEAGKTADLDGFINGTEKVYGLQNNGALGEKYEKGATASATNYSITSEGAFTPPTADGVRKYVVVFERAVKDGLAIYNVANKFPKSCYLLFKVLAVEPCTTGVLRAAYIEVPSFQPNADHEIALNTDATQDLSGVAQLAYCGEKKTLYNFFWAADDIEEEDE